MGFNIAFALGSYLLVRFQLAINRRWGVGQMITVFVVKFVDNVSDGATFFSANLTSVVALRWICALVS